MKELLDYLLKAILGNEEFTVTETEDNGKIDFLLKTDPKNVGMVIGKGGHIIKAIRNILKVRATLEKKVVSFNISDLL